MPDMDIERELEKESDDGDELIRAPEPPLQRNDDDETLKQFTVKFRSLALDPASRRYQGKSRFAQVVSITFSYFTDNMQSFVPLAESVIFPLHSLYPNSYT